MSVLYQHTKRVHSTLTQVWKTSIAMVHMIFSLDSKPYSINSGDLNDETSNNIILNYLSPYLAYYLPYDDINWTN